MSQHMPTEAPTAPKSTCLRHLLLEEVLSFLPGEEDPGPAHQSRHQAQLPPAVTRAVSVHPAVSPVAQLPAGPRAAVAAGFAAGV